MANKVFAFVALIGGTTGCLDAIDGDLLSDGDYALGMVNGEFYAYVLDADLGGAESSPGSIAPDTNAGNKRWVLKGVINQDLTSDASPAFAGLSLTGNTIRQNLLTNSGFGVWSNSTLENVGSDLVTESSNYVPGYDTFTQSGGDITSAIYSGGPGYEYCHTNATGMTEAKLYRLVVNLTLNSGQAPSCRNGEAASENGSHVGVTLSAGVNTFVFRFTETGKDYFWFHNAAASNWSAVITLYEVTPGCVAADTLGPDGWSKNSTSNQLYREHSGANTKAGSFYALKVRGDSSGSGAIWPNLNIYGVQTHYDQFRGRTVTVGAYIKTSTASAGRLRLYSSDGSTYSSYHTGSGAYEWLEVTASFSSTITEMALILCSEVNGDMVYFSQPMLVFSSSIGEGNYAPVPGEIIWLENANSCVINKLNGVSGFSDTGATTLCLDAETNGILPNNCRAICVVFGCADSGTPSAYAYLKLQPNATAGEEYTNHLFYGLTNDQTVRTPGWCGCNSDGSIQYLIEATGVATFDIEWAQINAVQLW